MGNFNWVDYIVLGIFLISILAGFSRGVIKEIISLATWVAAFVIASMFSTHVAALFTNSPQVASAVSSASGALGMNAAPPVSMAATGLSFVGLFALTLLIGSMIGSMVSGVVDRGAGGLFNRLLGGLFGLMRGVLVNVVIMFMVQLTPAQQQPWWSQSTFVNMFQPAVAWLSNMVQPGIENLKSKAGAALQDVGSKVQGAVSSVTGN